MTVNWGGIVSGLFNVLAGAGGKAAVVAKDVGVTALTVGSTTIPLATIVTQLDKLAGDDFSGIVWPIDFANFKSFLLSQQFENDLVPVADFLGVIGLFVPPVAVAANDIRMIATGLTVLHKFASVATALGFFTGGVPDGRGGYVPATNSHYDPKTGRFL